MLRRLTYYWKNYGLVDSVVRITKDFFLFIKNFGLAGIWLFIKVLLNKSDRLRINSVKSDIFLRPNTSDLSVFKQIFLYDEYAVSFPDNPKIIIDAGANIGLASVYFANKFPEATIFAIEPYHPNFEQLQKNIKDYKNIIPIEKGIWHSKTNIQLVDGDLGDWGMMTRQSAEKSVGDIETVTIQEIQQKSNSDIIDIVKIDIEGAEKYLFSENYEQWLPNTKLLIVELHDWMEKGSSRAVFNSVSKFDFSFSVKGENIVFSNNLLK